MKESSKRALKYQKKARRKGLCPKCGEPAARACESMGCSRNGVLTQDKVCSNCGHNTVKRRLCTKHLEYDKQRAANKRANKVALAA